METETTGLIPFNNPFPAPLKHNTEIEKSRAVSEVQTAMLVAKRFPRDGYQSYTRIMTACERPSLAKAAVYAFPRGGQTVSGASIHLAVVIAQNYGNIETGVREIERLDGKSIAEAFCWDLETNFKVVKQFEVPHEIMLTGGRMKQLTDPRDIYELVANQGSRRQRACILQVVPRDIVEDALLRCKKVLALGDKSEPMEDRLKRILMAFKAVGVTQKMLEEKLSHAMDVTTGEELVDLQGIYNSIKDGTVSREEHFDIATDSNMEGMKGALEKDKSPMKKT